MISWFAGFKNRFVKLEKIIKKTSRKSNAKFIDKIIEKGIQHGAKINHKSMKNESQKNYEFSEVDSSNFTSPGSPN